MSAATQHEIPPPLTAAATAQPNASYVGLSRATDRLIVVGDPDARWRMGGPDVCRQLGIPEHSSGGR